MKIDKWNLKCSVPAVIALLLSAGCAQEQAAVRPQPAVTPQPAAVPQSAAPSELENERDAKKILMAMARTLADTPRFSVSLNGSYEVLQASGQKIEFSERRKVIVSRPNGLRVEAEHSDGESHLVLYDGKTITTYTPNQYVYAQVSKPGGIDEAITYFLKDLQMRLPLAALLLSRLPTELERRTVSLDYVEKEVIHEMPVHHLAGRTDTVDYQIWVPAKGEPLPLRVVLTYKNAKGQPSFRADFFDWNLNPQIPDNQFVFTPPEGSRKIAFLAQLPKVALDEAAKPEQSGEKK
jgi:hypothetical protein